MNRPGLVARQRWRSAPTRTTISLSMILRTSSRRSACTEPPPLSAGSGRRPHYPEALRSSGRPATTSGPASAAAQRHQPAANSWTARFKRVAWLLQPREGQGGGPLACRPLGGDGSYLRLRSASLRLSRERVSLSRACESFRPLSSRTRGALARRSVILVTSFPSWTAAVAG